MKRTPVQSPTDLVLVGGGHSHVQVLESFAMDPPAGARVTLVVDRPIAMYSGMVPGFVAGQYRREELEIDVLPLARRVGARVVLARVRKIDAANKRLEFEGRPSLPFDLASINVGSTVAGLSTPGIREHAIPTRPIGDFVTKVDQLLADLSGDEAGSPVRLVVVGGGVGGVELAFGMEHRIRQQGRRVEVRLIESGAEILPGYSKGMRRRAVQVAESRGIRLTTGQRVARAETGRVLLEPGDEEVPFDLLLWVTGAVATPLFRESALETDERGFVKVRSTLQLAAHDSIFAVGDCATLMRYPETAKAGVYAVRQGPVLSANLRHVLAGGRLLESYRPQHDFLTLINTGDGGAIGGKWMLSFKGEWVFRLKDRIDRKFMHRFQPLENTGRRTAFDGGAMIDDGGESPDDGEAREVPCGGCAAKLSQDALGRALARLEAPAEDSSVELGLAQADDAASYSGPAGQRIVASVDQIRAFTDDAHVVGRVAAVNAASDVYAKGVEARYAQALISLPESAPEAEREEILFQVLAGARAVFDPLGITLLGGHTTTGGELLVGFHVEGFVEDGLELLAIDALSAGQSLILTKALGTGVVLRADMMGLARGPWLEAAFASMLAVNRTASLIARAHGARAATDVTGFGLAGHLLEMARAAGIAATVDIEALPALPGSLELLETGLRSTFHRDNARAERGMEVTAGARERERFPLLFDPQTSGGLVFGVPPASVEAALAELGATGHAAARIGETRAPNSEAALRIVTSTR